MVGSVLPCVGNTAAVGVGVGGLGHALFLRFEEHFDHRPHVVGEVTKICIRAIDGYKADWTASGRPGDIRMFWEEIGHKYRQQLMGMHMKMHSLTGEEAQDFLANCIVGVSVVPG